MLGQWVITRIIDDNVAENQGHFKGEGIFSPHSDTPADLLYKETGQLRIGDFSDTVFRGYIYKFMSPGTPEKAHVCFEDNKPFHDLDLISGAFTARHDCPPDVYTGQFTAISLSHWTVRWDITGPRKSLSITSDYHR